MSPSWRYAATAGTAVVGLLAASICSSVRAASPRIVFLDATQAVAALSAEETDGYFGELQPLEMSAKTGRGITGAGLAEQRAECRRRYVEAALDFTSEEIATLVSAVTKVHSYLQRAYPRAVEPGWSFIKLDSHIEGGLPHTIGPHIVLSPRVLAVFVASREREPDERLWNLAAWLLHAQLHVVQKRHPRLFGRLYSDVWGFQRADDIGSHPWLAEHQFVSPDVQRAVWVYPVRTSSGTEWIWPTIVLGESRGVRRLLGVPSIPRDLRMVAVGLVRTDGSFALRLDAGGMPVMRRLVSLEEYRGDFPFSMAPYHPDEIAAEGFARIVIAELRHGAGDGSAGDHDEGLDARTEQLRDWLASHLD